MDKVILKSLEGERVETTRKSVNLSLAIREMLENLLPDSKDIEIPFDKIKHQTLKKVVEWLDYNADIAQPSVEEVKEKLAESISQWDQDFLEMSLPELYDLVSHNQEDRDNEKLFKFCILDRCRQLLEHPWTVVAYHTCRCLHDKRKVC